MATDDRYPLTKHKWLDEVTAAVADSGLRVFGAQCEQGSQA